MFLSDEEFKKAMSGNIKNKAKRTTHLNINIDIKKKMEKEAIKEGITQLQYLNMVLEHYWQCKNK